MDGWSKLTDAGIRAAFQTGAKPTASDRNSDPVARGKRRRISLVKVVVRRIGLVILGHMDPTAIGRRQSHTGQHRAELRNRAVIRISEPHLGSQNTSELEQRPITLRKPATFTLERSPRLPLQFVEYWRRVPDRNDFRFIPAGESLPIVRGAPGCDRLRKWCSLCHVSYAFYCQNLNANCGTASLSSPAGCQCKVE